MKPMVNCNNTTIAELGEPVRDNWKEFLLIGSILENCLFARSAVSMTIAGLPCLCASRLLFLAPAICAFDFETSVDANATA
jgi:hypothetical protein